jgi:ribonuclease Y
MLDWYVAVIIGAGALVAGTVLGILVRKMTSEAKLGSAEVQAKRMLDDAMKNAESVRKESVLSAKEEIFQMKKEADFDIKERRKEVSRLERRIAQKEESLDAKIEGLEKKDALLTEKFQEAEQMKQSISETLKQQQENLEKIAGLTAEEAKADAEAKAAMVTEDFVFVW